MSKKTVFICYRTKGGGKTFAGAIHQALTSHGYDAFFAPKSMKAGDWRNQIRPQVRNRAHFLILLTPGALALPEQGLDWVREEFEAARKWRRNIVPIRHPTTDLQAEFSQLPKRWQRLLNYQICDLSELPAEREMADLLFRY